MRYLQDDEGASRDLTQAIQQLSDTARLADGILNQVTIEGYDVSFNRILGGFGWASGIVILSDFWLDV